MTENAKGIARASRWAGWLALLILIGGCRSAQWNGSEDRAVSDTTRADSFADERRPYEQPAPDPGTARVDGTVHDCAEENAWYAFVQCRRMGQIHLF